jgi:hypothetical protein
MCHALGRLFVQLLFDVFMKFSSYPGLRAESPYRLPRLRLFLDRQLPATIRSCALRGIDMKQTLRKVKRLLI